MYAIACQSIEEDWQSSHKSLTFTSSHLGNLSLMEYSATEKLDVVMNHLPWQIVSACRPVIMIDGFVAVDGDEVFLRVTSQLAVKVGGSHHCLFVLRKASSGILYNGKYFGTHLVKSLFIDFQGFLLQFVYLIEDILTFVNRCIFNGGFQLGYLLFLFVSGSLHLFLYFLGASTKFVVAHFLNLWCEGFHLFH